MAKPVDGSAVTKSRTLAPYEVAHAVKPIIVQLQSGKPNPGEGYASALPPEQTCRA
jgi:hypothetical protein